MVKVQCRIFSWCGHLLEKVWIVCSLTKLLFFSLFYNESADKYYVGDACMEPMFWVVDHFTNILGPVCVTIVILLTTSVVVIVYAIGLPFYLEQSVFHLLLLLSIGHWLLLNIVFYYYMAYVTVPGYPPQGAMITDTKSICKRCIAPKPPRSHHCIVCNRCVLKMDHHCPWMNNCIGHFNHRYFFMFCAYTWIGVLFCIISGLPIFHDHFWGNSLYTFSPHVISLIKSITELVSRQPRTLQDTSDYKSHTSSTNFNDKWISTLYHSCVVYISLLCIAVMFLLGGLLAWHARLISNGETSIESHINKGERKKCLKEGNVYKNPFDFGVINNWKIFLRVDSLGSWWRILFPYTVAPAGNGIQWKFLDKEEAEINLSL